MATYMRHEWCQACQSYRHRHPSPDGCPERHPPAESKARRRYGPVTETVTITRERITVSYSDPELCLTPELTAKLQAFWSTRIEEMAYRIMAGCDVPEREQSVYTAATHAGMFPNGGSRRDRFAPMFHCPKFVAEIGHGPDPAKASQEAADGPSLVPAATIPLKPE